ncbi:hypothetical protein [Segatella bryantii]|uniref:hypothetical protein n=1 Tax=Segatella bryantii TaxID=77095 RepID=UPI00242AC167|nr:hypothetical protein [Segatella bryantii]
MEPYTITAELNLKKIIAELKEFAESLDEFADELEKIEKGVEKSMTFVVDKKPDDYDDLQKYSNNGFPHFMEELTEDDLEESEDEE